MGFDDDIDELKEKRLCYKCIGETYLKSEVQKHGQPGNCSYCGEKDQTTTIENMADRVETAFDQHFIRTSDQPNSWQLTMLKDRESDYVWERDGEPVVWAIANAAQIPEQAAQDIHLILEDKFDDFDAAAMGEETEFCSESYYEEKSPSDSIWQEEWREFERSLKTEARFFSRSAATHLASIFGGIDELFAADGRPLVINAGPNTKMTQIYRARVFQSNVKLKEALRRPDRHLGPPPPTCATAGRMNARGISVFYGANDPAVAIAEVRPPVGSQVIVVCFDIIRPIRLLDLTALDEVFEDGSIFDSGFAARLERVVFLRSLSQRITKPVMPDDEALEYLSTQAIADFLATENTPTLDGIVFPSVQVASDGLNIVLFHKAARVEAFDVEEGVEVEVNTGSASEDGWEEDYSIVEWVPPEVLDEEKGKETQWNSPMEFAIDPWCEDIRDYNRKTTVRIDLESIKVHNVRGVQFQCDGHTVRRSRIKKTDTDF